MVKVMRRIGSIGNEPVSLPKMLFRFPRPLRLRGRHIGWCDMR